MRQPLRREVDSVTSVVALFVLAALSSLSLVVLAFTLALGF